MAALPHVADDDAVPKQCTAAPVVPNPCHGESCRDIAGASLPITIDESDAISSSAEEVEDSSPCQRLGDDDDSRDGQTSGHSIFRRLPEDVCFHIHSLMPMAAAARAACLSRAFLRSWRCHPKLILSSKTAMKRNGNISRRIESIPKKHSGIGVKILSLQLHDEYTCFFHIDWWLKFAVRPGIEELNLATLFISRKYSFPCSVLSVGVRNSIQSLHLHTCVFRPTAKLIGPFPSLTSLRLHSVSITRNQLEWLLSNSLALERLDLKDCREITSLKIPSVLRRIQEINLCLPKEHNFQCSVLSSAGVRNSIRSIKLDSCVFRPTDELGPLRSLTSLCLHSVSITGDELDCLLSNSLALESLQLTECHEIISLKIPSVLQHLSYLLVDECYGMQIIENKAPIISRFTLSKVLPKLELGEASQLIKILELDFIGNSVRYARAVLPFKMPNLETLSLSSWHEENTPMLRSKFVNLKHLYIQIISSTLSPSYVYSSLISFLDASPSLETWWLEVPLADMGHELVGSSDLKELPQRRHDNLKSLEISGFHSTKSLVELTYCIVKSAVSLESLTLDTICSRGSPCCSGLGSICSKFTVEQASRAVVAIRRYIEDKVAPTTKLTVLEYCPQCIEAAVDDGLGPLV